MLSGRGRAARWSRYHSRCDVYNKMKGHGSRTGCHPAGANLVHLEEVLCRSKTAIPRKQDRTVEDAIASVEVFGILRCRARGAPRGGRHGRSGGRRGWVGGRGGGGQTFRGEVCAGR